jgi:hypothetical protein
MDDALNTAKGDSLHERDATTPRVLKPVHN